MSEPIMSAAAVKAGAGTVAALAATEAGIMVVQGAERMILGIHQSVLLAAIVGALIGVLILSNADAERIASSTGTVTPRKALALLIKAGFFAAFVLGFALVSAWTVTLFGRTFGAEVTTKIPAAGLLGVFIRPLLPSYVGWIERIGSAWADLLARAGGGR